MQANCSRFSSLTPRVAPESSNITGGVNGRTVPIAGRRTPLDFLTIRDAPVKSAPVFPALTHTSPRPSARSPSAIAIDESFFARTTDIGSSFIVITTSEFTISTSERSSDISPEIFLMISSLPTSIKLSSLHSFLASATPLSISSGALSPLIASTIILILIPR